MNYREERSVTAGTKSSYVNQLDVLLAKKQGEAAGIRAEYVRDIFQEPERYRADLRQMLGWPLVGQEDTAPPAVTVQELSREDGYTIYRMGIEILEGLTMTGLYFRGQGKKPLVIAQHGGSGTPELIANFYGTTTNYHQMLHRIRQQDVHVFAPQLLLWGDNYDIPYDRRGLDARLKRVGSSIAAVELYGITRILDYFETQPEVSCFGMVGLSYGGFYTLFATAIDTRIQGAVSCSFFNTRDVIGWSDWTWQCSAEKFDDPEIACLIYPRPLCLAVGDKDSLFSVTTAEESFRKLRELCRDVGTDWLETIVFDGVHEFYKEDAPIIRLVQHLKNQK